MKHSTSLKPEPKASTSIIKKSDEKCCAKGAGRLSVHLQSRPAIRHGLGVVAGLSRIIRRYLYNNSPKNTPKNKGENPSHAQFSKA